jgi:ribonuclease HI
MREVWPLKEHIPNTGKEWLFQALDQATEQERMMMLMTFWRIWHVRNEVIHQKEAPPVEASRRFLCSYVDSLLMIKQNPQADLSKGKTVIVYDHMQSKGQRRKQHTRASREDQGWTKPTPGWAKLNVDGAWMKEEGKGGIGMILRDEDGSIIFTASRYLPVCESPLEAEILACNEGLALALEQTEKPILVESDCLELCSMVNDNNINRSQFAALIDVTKSLCRQERTCHVSHIRRECNGVSHTLARFGYSGQCTRVWYRHGPDIIRQACNQDGSPFP